MNDSSGVQYVLGPLPPVMPGPIASSLKSQVHLALAEIPPGKRGAIVGVATEGGVNLVVAHRSEDARWHATAWIGKTWQGPITGGVFVKTTW